MNTARLNQGTPLLLSAVTKQYAANTVLNQLDLHIQAGQFVAVVGRSGGGKSCSYSAAASTRATLSSRLGVPAISTTGQDSPASQARCRSRLRPGKPGVS